MKNVIAILILAIGLLGCQPEGRVYSEHQELSPNLEWLISDVPEFEVPIVNNSSPYRMSMTFRYANGYQYQVLRVKLTETSPSGKQVVTEHELKVREDNGDYIGEAGFDIWDSEHLIAAQKTFDEVGTYTYSIEHNMPIEVLNFAMDIGLLLDKVE